MAVLIADSGATKCEWCVVEKKRKKQTVFTQGISPYFLNTDMVENIIRSELSAVLRTHHIDAVFYYGTGCKNPSNVRMIKSAILRVFQNAHTEVTHDLMAAARALFGHHKGIACILGTGSNSCYYNGSKIVKNSPGLGYILGDEGSGANLGKKVLQYYLYGTFDDELKYKFEEKYSPEVNDILDNVYKKPLANRYLASYAAFLSENRGHYMIENIIEDTFNEFFFNHLCKYRESWLFPVSFVGGVSFAFQDALQELCRTYEFDFGKVMRNPMEGLIEYHADWIK